MDRMTRATWFLVQHALQQSYDRGTNRHVAGGRVGDFGVSRFSGANSMYESR